MLLRSFTSFIRIRGQNIFQFSRFQGAKSPASLFTAEEGEEDGNLLRQAYRDLALQIERGDNESVLALLNGKKKVEQKEATQEEIADEELTEYYKSLSRSLSLYMASLSPEEQLLRSKQLSQSMKQRTDWSETEGINQEYQDYSLFDKTLLKIKNTSPTPDQKNEDFLDFIKDLDQDSEARKGSEDHYSFFYRDPAGLNTSPTEQPDRQTGFFVRKYKPEFEQYLKDLEDKENDPTLDEVEKQLEWNNKSSNIENPYMIESDDETYKPRLSFRARNEIFDLYNQGWSVRDLSVRFGAIPARVKAIIYQHKYFFTEIFPTLSMDDLQWLIRMETEYEEMHEVCDYGIDIEEFHQLESGSLRTIFKHQNRNVDIEKLEPHEQAKLRKLFLKKKTRKYDIVTEKFSGEGNKGYFVRNWHMHLTRSKPRVNSIFERVLRDGQERQFKLPKTAQRKLSLGPRRASTSHGIN